MVDITPEDMVVVMAFRRRTRLIRPLMQQLQQRGILLLALCEPQTQLVIALARWQLCAPLDSVSGFNSYASAMSLINLPVSALLHEMLSQGHQRIHQIADLYQQFDELEHR
nr:MurR/RpiR family transcriptional regulator [Candidatus Pantoea persica]